MQARKALLSIACLLTVLFSASAASADEAYWTDWTSSGSSTVTGALTIGTTVVNVAFSGTYASAQTSGGTNYWSYPIYDVPNRPANYDIIRLNTGGTATITFSQKVHDPLMALVSWNSNTVHFGVPIEIVSNGRGYFGSGTPIPNQDGDGFYGSGEVHGVIRFVGDYDSITFSHTSENWHGFTLGVTDLAVPVPVPAAAWLFGPGLVGIAAIRRRFKK